MVLYTTTCIHCQPHPQPFRSGLRLGSGGTVGRTTMPFECEWHEPCPSPHLQPGSVSTASNRPQLCEHGSEHIISTTSEGTGLIFLSCANNEVKLQNRLYPGRTCPCVTEGPSKLCCGDKSSRVGGFISFSLQFLEHLKHTKKASSSICHITTGLII